jgi:hypothetical protein
LSQRLAIFAGVVIGHALLLWLLSGLTQFRPLPARHESVSTRVEFISRIARKQNQDPVSQRQNSPPLSSRPRPAARRAVEAASTSVAPGPDDPPLKVATADGAVWVPKAAMDEFLEHGQTRQFDVQRPGLDDMKRLLNRPVALEFKGTRFDKDWQGERPRLERILEKAVEKSTATVKIPIPGRPGAYLRCGIAVLALGGSCGFTANDDGYYVKADDPETLSPLEEKQSQAWWDLIVSAKSQDVWRKTRQLYEQECRKPLAKP